MKLNLHEMWLEDSMKKLEKVSCNHYNRMDFTLMDLGVGVCKRCLFKYYRRVLKNR